MRLLGLTIGLVVVLLASGGKAARSPALQAADRVAAADEMIQQLIRRYRELVTYRDRVTVEVDAEPTKRARVSRSDDALPGPFGDFEAATSSLRWARRGRFALTSDELEVYSDGRQLWRVAPAIGQYTIEPAPRGLVEIESALVPSARGDLGAHPVIALLTARGTRLPAIERWEQVVDEKRGREPGYRVSGTLRTDPLQSTAPISISFWIDATSRLLREVRYDLTESMNRFADLMEVRGEVRPGWPVPPRYERFVMTATIDEIIINIPIDPSRFEYPDQDGFALVQSFDPDAPVAIGEQLVGSDVPKLAARDVNGVPVRLEDFRGRVLVLDFWALWCRPCLAAMPSVQAVADEFHGRPVTVLGVNRDAPGLDARVRAYVDGEGLTFRQLRDPAGRLAAALGVRSYPTTIVIDATGVVQDFTTGFPRGHEQYLKAAVEALLAEKKFGR